MSDRVEYLLAEVAIQVPELAPALARISLEEMSPEQILQNTGGATHVAYIHLNGRGGISSKLIDDNPSTAKMVIGHEALHLVCERVARIEDLSGPQWDGDYRRANIAADRWINQILVDLGITTPAAVNELGGVLPGKGQEEWDLLELWRAEGKGRGKAQGGTMAGCAPSGSRQTPQDAQGGQEDIDRDQEAHSILAGLASMAPGLRRMVNPPPPSVRWQDVLHEAAAAARGAGMSNRPRVTRSKLGRRSSPEVPKPGQATRRPQLVVVVDISGSMSGLLDQVVGECEAIAKMAHTHLILHDSAVLFSGQYKKGRDKITPCGGTDFGPAIAEAARVVKAWPGRSAVVHLTDGCPCGDWPDVPADFSSGYAGIFGGYTITAPGRWRTRRCDPVGGGAK